MFGAVDIGGTKTLVAVFGKKGEIVERVQFSTPKDYEEFKVELAKAVAKLATDDFLRVVTAIPGLVNRKKGIGVAFGNLPWEVVPIQHDLEQIFHSPVVVENDAKLAALSEALLVKDDYRKVLYVTISTGIGGGYIIDGKIDPDFENIEPGHMLLEHNDRLVRWEKFASGKAVYEKYGKKFSDISDPQTWYVVARNIAVGLINLIATLTPEIIIIGGGAGAHLEKFKDRLDEELKIYENPLVRIPTIVKAQRAEDAVIYGCYEFAKQHHVKVTA